MARKKSLKGRAKKPTVISSLNILIEKTNRKLRSLDKAGLYGHYSTLKLLRSISGESDISYKRKRRNKIKLNRKPSIIGKTRLYLKNFQSFVRSKTSSPIGIKDVRKKTESKLKKTLGNMTDKEVTDEDLDDFYQLMNDRDVKQNKEKIPPSNVYVLLQEAKEKDMSSDNFSKQLQIAMNSNNEDTRKMAERLYNKFVR
ncbi:MAG: hypothetical protein IIZ99_03630 [Turicibacter sp.]|nr:hypothetical protein [Turicibacter sp.]